MANPIYSILGNTENSFSIVFALLLSYHKIFLEWLIKKCDLKNGLAITDIETEKYLDSQENRIDILINLTDGFRIGIENKKWTGFQENQILRYKESSYFINSEKSKLVVLTPSKYYWGDTTIDQSVKKINYREVIDFLKNNNPSNSILINDVINLFSEVEMSPLSLDEIKSMTYFASANAKLNSVLQILRKKDDGRIENSTGLYKLFYRSYGEYLFYFGFRFGTDWYIKYPLLNNNPECIVYLRSYNSNINLIENILLEKFNSLKSIFPDDILNCLELLNGEVKLIVRKNISDFENIDDISKWFNLIDSKIQSNFA